VEEVAVMYRPILLFLNTDQIVSLNQDMRLLKDENKYQNMEIALLKEMLQSQDKIMNEKIITEIEQSMRHDENLMADAQQYPSAGRV